MVCRKAASEFFGRPLMQRERPSLGQCFSQVTLAGKEIRMSQGRRTSLMFSLKRREVHSHIGSAPSFTASSRGRTSWLAPEASSALFVQQKHCCLKLCNPVGSLGSLHGLHAQSQQRHPACSTEKHAWHALHARLAFRLLQVSQRASLTLRMTRPALSDLSGQGPKRTGL